MPRNPALPTPEQVRKSLAENVANGGLFANYGIIGHFNCAICDTDTPGNDTPGGLGMGKEYGHVNVCNRCYRRAVADHEGFTLTPAEELLAAAMDVIETFEAGGMPGGPILRLRAAVRLAIGDPNWTGVK
jgi:hypothetical protein